MIMELEYMELVKHMMTHIMEHNMKFILEHILQRIMELILERIMELILVRIMEHRSIHHMYLHINPHMVVVVEECFRSSMGSHSIRHLRILLRHQLDILIQLQ
jgi:hypothetical protein